MNAVWYCDISSEISLPLSVKLCNFVMSYNEYFMVNNQTLLDTMAFINSILDIEIINISFIYQYQIPGYLFVTKKVVYIYNHFIFEYAYNYLLLLGFSAVNIFFLYLTRVEKELNTIEDILIFNNVLVLFIFFILGFYFYYVYIMSMALYFIYYTCIMLVYIICLLPVSLLVQYGFYSVYYLRGTSTSLNIVYEVTLDYINLISFFLRILIQFIRIFLILLTVISLNEIFLEINTFFTDSSVYSSTFSWYSTFMWVVQYIFEWLHFSIIFFVQLLTFVLMINWLFQFLFSMFNKQLMESFFMYLRKL